MTGYLGSKGGSGVYQKIISNMPAHDVYIEAFLGSGVIMKLMPGCHRRIGIDLDIDVLEPSMYPGVELLNCDSRDYIANFDYTGQRVFIYADPPYLHSTRGKDRYKFEFDDQDHWKLLSLLNNVPVHVMISGYPSVFYDYMLKDWRKIEFTAMSRGGKRTECLWMNYPENTPLHTPMFAGVDYTDRQRIKRKAERWKKKFLSMPPGEQAAILEALTGTG